MRLTIVAVGRMRRGPAADLYRDYAGRLRWPLELIEVEERRALPADALKEREADLLLASVPRGARIVALDERGETLTSRGLAERIEAWRSDGVRDCAFLIGGADGHGAAVSARADLVLSLGPMTWPHLLVRGMLAEQLYRAQQLLSGHPYHRD